MTEKNFYTLKCKINVPPAMFSNSASFYYFGV